MFAHRSVTPLYDEERSKRVQLLYELDMAAIELHNPEGRHVWVWGPLASGKSTIVNAELRQPNICVLHLNQPCNLTMKDLIKITEGDNYDRIIVESTQPMEAIFRGPELDNVRPHFIKVFIPTILYQQSDTVPSTRFQKL